MGRFVYTVMLAMGEYFLETIKAGWVTAKSKAIDRGAHIGPTPFGYARNHDGTLSVDPMAGPIVSEAFAICARDGLPAAIDFLSERARDRSWSTFTARRFFSQRVYLGQVAYGDHVRAGAHEALVSRAVFEAVRHQLGDGERTRRPKEGFPLSGVAVCGSCGASMVGGRGGADARRMYRCSKRCAAPAVTSAVPLEEHVVAFLREAFQHPGMRVGGKSPNLDAAEAALLEAEQELDAFASDLSARRLLGDSYHRHLQQRVDALEQAREQLHAVMAAAEDSAVVVPEELWDDLTPAELSDVLRSTLASVVVSRGRGPLDRRVVVVPKGTDGAAGAGTQDAHAGSL
jgi:site-specific DNA recombinase